MMCECVRDGFRIQLFKIIFMCDKFKCNPFEPNTTLPRISLEVVYEAVVDAGVNIKSLSGRRVGVFMSTSCSEALDIWLRSTEIRTGHYITGCHPSMLADQISYAFNFKGPSCVFDSGCSASFSALQYAMLAIKSGLCDSAIVGGANINTFPLISNAFCNLGALSVDGKCKAFDASADGFVRSEAVVALYICRKDCAKRMYATISGIKCFNDGHKRDGISVPSSKAQAQLIKELYAETGVNPLEVTYVEAHGTGTKAGDPKEIAALADIFCTGRVGPLLVGSVKSNMGHSEQVSGLCGVIKVLLARQFEVIPPNLHFKTPNPECKALVDGRIQVVVQHTPFHGRYVGLNSFGLGGTTGHVILKFEDVYSTPTTTYVLNSDVKFPSVPVSMPKTIPILILASGRTREAVTNLLTHSMQIRSTSSHGYNNFIGLLHEIASDHVPKHKFLGYAVRDPSTEFEVAIVERVESSTSVHFVYTGLGSQYVGMTKTMINFKTFNNSVQLSTQLMRRVGMDLESVLQTEDIQCINSLQNAFVAITACQMALTDLLESLDICPDIRGLKTSSSASIISPQVTPIVSKQKFCAYFDPDESQSKRAVLDLFFEIVLDNLEKRAVETFIFTEITDCGHQAAVDLHSLVYFKFMYYEHRILQAEKCMKCGSNTIPSNSKIFHNIEDLRLIPP
ncbi:unnamed protein product, partial [Allacma fusca]